MELNLNVVRWLTLLYTVVMGIDAYIQSSGTSVLFLVVSGYNVTDMGQTDKMMTFPSAINFDLFCFMPSSYCVVCL